MRGGAGAPFTVTEVALAARCPRQVVLRREGIYATLKGEGSSAIGSAAHQVLHSLCRVTIDRWPQLSAHLKPPSLGTELPARLYDSVWPDAYRAIVALIPQHSVADMVRFDRIVRSLCGWLSSLFLSARRHGAPVERIAGLVLRGSERDVTLDLPSGRIVGRIDLLCHDPASGEDWLWDLKTFPANDDPAGEAQIQLYALALESAGAQPSIALLHVTGDRIELRRKGAMARADADRLAAAMGDWIARRSEPPRAASDETCRRCTAQAQCWARWGRTLADGSETARPAPAISPPAISPSTSTNNNLLLGMGGDGHPVELPVATLCRHAAVFGSNGSGKTWFAKVILEEAALAGVPIVAFDVAGDVVQLAARRPERDVPESLRPRWRRFGDTVGVRVWTPASDVGQRLSLNPLMLPPRGLADADLDKCAEAIAAGVLAAAPYQSRDRRFATQAIAQVIKDAVAGGETLDFDELADAIEMRPGLLTKTDTEKLTRALRFLTRGTASHLYAKGEPFRVEQLLAGDIAGRSPLNIIYLLTVPLDLRPLVVATVLAQIYTWMLASPPSEGKPRLVVFLDEVGPYLPPANRKEPASKDVLKRLYQEGRKYGVCGLFCTQGFTDVDYKVLDQANTKAIGRLGSAQNQKKAIEILGERMKDDVAKRLGSLARTFVLDCPDVFPVSSVLVESRELLTHHGGAWAEDELRGRLVGARPPR